VSAPTYRAAGPRTGDASAAPATAPATRRTHEPAIVQPGRNPRARSRVRVQWLALAAALIVLAGTVVAWALSRAAERVPVVSVARPVQAGDVLTVDDFTISEVAIDADVRGLVPATSLPNLAGRVAAIDLSPGMLVSTGMWAEDPELRSDERTIGAVLRAGRFPSGLVHGTTAWAIDVRSSGSAASSGKTDDATSGLLGEPITVRVLDAEVDETGDLHVTLAVPASAAVQIASWAATDTLALAGVPAPATIASIPAAADTASTLPIGAP